jgi:hypothetical protein
MLSAPVYDAAGHETVFRAALVTLVSQVAIDYGDERILGQAVVLRGEPLYFDVGIVNPYHGPLAGAERDWLRRVAVTLFHGDRFDSQRRFVSNVVCESNASLLRSEDTEDAADLVLLRTNGAQFYRCRVDPAKYGLEHGPYTVSTQWKADAIEPHVLRQEYESREPSVLTFEFRDIRSPGDALDLDIHLAWRAFHERNDPADALRLAERVLAREPRSTTALIVRGRAHAALGRCREAQDDWLQVATIVEGGLDRLNRRHWRFGTEERQRVAISWRETARKACG